MFEGDIARTDQIKAALRDIAGVSYHYYRELQQAGFTESEAWEVMLTWNERFASMLYQPSS